MEKQFILEALNPSGNRKLYDIYLESNSMRYNPREQYPHSDCFMTIKSKSFSFSDFGNGYRDFIMKLHNQDKSDLEIIKAAKKEFGDGVVVKPIYGLDHSGLVLSLAPFPDHFDSGVAGYLLAFKDWSCKEQDLEDSLNAQVQELNEYLDGSNIYKVSVFDRETSDLVTVFINLWDYGEIKAGQSDILDRVEDCLYDIGFSEMEGYESNTKEAVNLIAKHNKKMPEQELLADYEDAGLTLFKIGDCYALYNYSDEGHSYYFPVSDFSFCLAAGETIYEKEIFGILDYDPSIREEFFADLANEKPEIDDQGLYTDLVR